MESTTQVLLVILGGVLAIAGGCLGNLLSAQLSRDAERRRVRREKLERLATLAISVNDWLRRYQEDFLAVPPRDTPSEPMEEMYMLTDLYFHEVRMEVHRFCHAVRDLVESINRRGLQRSEQRDLGNPEWYSAGVEEFTKEHEAKFPVMIRRQKELIRALGSLGAKIDDDDWITKSARYVWHGSRSDPPR